MADGGLCGKKGPGAASAGVEAEEERAGRGRRELWVRVRACFKSRRLGVGGRSVCG